MTPASRCPSACADGGASGGRYHYTAIDGPEDAAGPIGPWRAALRHGDALELRGTAARVLREGREVAVLEAPPSDVLVRLFA